MFSSSEENLLALLYYLSKIMTMLSHNYAFVFRTRDRFSICLEFGSGPGRHQNYLISNANQSQATIPFLNLTMQCPILPKTLIKSV